MLRLKPYQQRTLEALKTYLQDARLCGDPKKAFKDFVAACVTDPGNQSYRHRYGLDHVPYVCLRLPTGGGKTFLASHAVPIAASAYMEKDFPVVLWLVPTNAIRLQTIEALKQPSHAYREAIDNAFNGQVAVFDISEVEQIRPKDLLERVCIIVGTLATLRVSNTDGRRIYAHNENFEPHFTKLPNTAPGLEKDEQGQIKFSFVNVLHQLQPLIIMDEAHKAKTDLTGEVMHRLNPACIIEFTATPIESNILYRVTASELKAEEMIKLPIILTEHGDWQKALTATVLTRNALTKAATSDPDYIRPIVLIQAENRAGTATVAEIKKHLIENEKVAENEIAIATGDQRELDGINLFDRTCPIHYVITIEALKEGWDCPFAYVFCSVANIRSNVAVEQFLGRVLRMPYAKRRGNEDLNKAYAHVISPSFAYAAEELERRLTGMGFQDEEARENVKPGHLSLPGMDDLPLFKESTPPLILVVSEEPKLYGLKTTGISVQVDPLGTGEYKIKVEGSIDDALVETLIQAVPAAQQKEIRRVIEVHRHTHQKEKSPSEKSEQFLVPRLCVEIQGELEIAEKETLLIESGWNPNDYSAEFGPSEFSYDDDSRSFSFDIKGNRIVYEPLENTGQRVLPGVALNWTDLMLVRWIDGKIHQADISQPVMLEFIRKCVVSLSKSGIDLASLVRAKYALATAILQKIERYRQEAFKKGFQFGLFGPSAKVETSFNYAFRYDPNNYPAKSFYRGGFQFKKHFYPYVGDLKSDGEEFECARLIEACPQVKYWVRNIAREESASFWLPTSSYKFYPDFVAQLQDGRIMVIEYKGEHLADGSEEKKSIGELWEEKSNGKGLFLMALLSDAHGRDVQKQIQAKINA
ncbi:DEAD/DEAH box helicase family protein [Desulfocurvibacter africanus]|uniref:DEAD/DEAH box helicase n=1 Tax=Desulfocurvibacter africanus TaxID=873 RepID=UPI002FDAEE4E